MTYQLWISRSVNLLLSSNVGCRMDRTSLDRTTTRLQDKCIIEHGVAKATMNGMELWHRHYPIGYLCVKEDVSTPNRLTKGRNLTSMEMMLCSTTKLLTFSLLVRRIIRVCTYVWYPACRCMYLRHNESLGAVFTMK